MYKGRNPENDEVQIEIEGKEFTCSRSELCLNSDYFLAMFHGEFTEKDKKAIVIQDVPEKGFTNCLNFIKDEKTYFEIDQLLDMLHCSCVLQFSKIKQYCIDRFITHLPLEFCLDIWDLTDLLEVHPLCEMAKCLALINFNKLKDMKCILQLNIKQLHSYLANQLIFCDNELDIFQTGMNWWYENSTKLKESEEWNLEDTTKYLYAILTCVDFKSLKKSDVNHMLTFPDIKTNEEISNILLEISKLIDNPGKKLKKDLERRVRNLYFDSKSRTREMLPCVVTSEFPWQPEQKRAKMERKITISYYDYVSKGMKAVFPENNEFCTKGSQYLKGSKILPYNQNLISFGGEFSYGSANWNLNIWMFHTFKEEWELITKMPEERRHFFACIVDDKLFIIGGTRKYRVKVSYEMMIYDFTKDIWIKNIHVPYSSNDIRSCEYKKKLLVIQSVADNQFGYIFDLKTQGWIKLNIEFPPNFKFDFTKNFVLFSKGESIYIKGSHLIEMQIVGSTLKVMNFSNCEELHGDKLNYFFNNNNLYVFSAHDSLPGDQIYQLHSFNLDTKINKLLVQINDRNDYLWHLRRGCFPFFHYSITKNVKCISEFAI